MTTHPTTAELVEAVTLFLEQTVAPHMKDRDAFLTRVAVNALGVVRRELEQGAAADAASAERLASLLAPGATDADLCGAIRGGRVDATTPGLLAHLRAETEARLRIDQPGYSGLRGPAES